MNVITYKIIYNDMNFDTNWFTIKQKEPITFNDIKDDAYKNIKELDYEPENTNFSVVIIKNY